MVTDISPSTKAVGFWSAVLATVFSISYIVGQIAEWMGLMGSGGGTENASTPLGLVVLLTPSLFLGSSFLVLVVSIHQLSSHRYHLSYPLFLSFYSTSTYSEISTNASS